jgi:hypothetical protein
MYAPKRHKKRHKISSKVRKAVKAVKVISRNAR